MSDKSLVRLVSEFSHLDQKIIDAGGEISPELEAELDLNSGEISQKIDNYKLYMDHLEFRSSYFKSISDQASDAASMFLNQVKRMKDALKLTSKRLGTSDLIGNSYRFKVSSIKPKLIVEPIELVPAKYLKEVVKIELDKDLIIKDLEAGIEVPGCRLEDNFSIRQYVNVGSNSKDVING
jgi:hypothetical protein